MAFISFSPGTQAKSSDVNSNFTNAVHKTDVQTISNKIPVLAGEAVTFSATPDFNLATGNFKTITLTNNVTSSTVSNVSTYQPFVIRVEQGGAGSFTFAWFSGIKWAGGITPVLSTTAGKADMFGFICTSVGNYDGFIIGQYL